MVLPLDKVPNYSQRRFLGSHHARQLCLPIRLIPPQKSVVFLSFLILAMPTSSGIPTPSAFFQCVVASITELRLLVPQSCLNILGRLSAEPCILRSEMRRRYMML